MNLLLDTHVLLWVFGGDPRLSADARRTIRDGRRVVYVSAVTAWEISIKKALGKLRAPQDYMDGLERYRFTPLDVTSEHALSVEHLPMHHRDPFDRMLIAQARFEKLALVTADERLTSYDVKIVKADAAS